MVTGPAPDREAAMVVMLVRLLVVMPYKENQCNLELMSRSEVVGFGLKNVNKFMLACLLKP